MKFEGVLTKMQTENGSPIQYYLVFENDFLNVNQLLDKTLSISFVKFQCLNCGQDKKIYRQGYCYDCFFEVPQVADWVIRPELSMAHLNKEDRDLEYEKKMQLQPHIVYLANSSNVKVGVTRKSQVPTRWIDQGAHEAIEIGASLSLLMKGKTLNGTATQNARLLNAVANDPYFEKVLAHYDGSHLSEHNMGLSLIHI